MQSYLEMTGVCKTYEIYGTQIKALDKVRCMGFWGKMVPASLP